MIAQNQPVGREVELGYKEAWVYTNHYTQFANYLHAKDASTHYPNYTTMQPLSEICAFNERDVVESRKAMWFDEERRA